MLRSVLLLLGLLASTSPAFAQGPSPGGCQTGQAERDLDVGGVRATLRNNGGLFRSGSSLGAQYEVPLGANASPIFGGGLWVGGHVSGDLRVAGSRYDNFEFWPGPLAEDGTLPNPADCSAYDRIWVVNALDVLAYEEEGITTDDLLDWPVALGAPVVDGDGIEGNYDLEGGDRPRVYGSQTAFWVMNDVGNQHVETGTPPLGIEVRVTAFGVATENEALHQATFYRYEVVNKSPFLIEDTHLAFFLDPDLGDSNDDFVGSDPERDLAFAYNATNEDADYGLPPAIGLDLFRGPVLDLDGDGETNDTLRATRITYFNNTGGTPTSDPNEGGEYYNYMRGLWPDGSPLMEYGDGYLTGGDLVPHAFPGDPEQQAFWSEVNSDGSGGSNSSGDRRLVVASGPFDFESGDVQTLEFGLLFARGEDHLNSVTALKAVSDEVQALYDSGALFATVTPTPVDFETPVLTAPNDGATFVETPPVLEWTGVPEAVHYRVQLSSEPDFSDPTARFSNEPTLTLPEETLPANQLTTFYWRVRAEGIGSVGSFSEPRSFAYYRYEFDTFGNGFGIVESEHPYVDDVCEDDPWDPGCSQGYPGNTVWRSPNSTESYVLTTDNNSLNLLLGSAHVLDGEDLEIRFTEDCATPGVCLGVYASALPYGTDLIVALPFELWNVGQGLGEDDDPSDDVRMIPMLRAHTDTDPSFSWHDHFPTTQEVATSEGTFELPVTQRVLGLMPDRPDGYALFADAAHVFGGPGATYDPENDGDEQIDVNPTTDDACGRQNYYADFCWRGGSPLVTAPIGGLSGFVLADLDGSGQTPPAGTTIRFVTADLLVVSREDDAPGMPSETLSLDAAYPNPFGGASTRVTIPFRIARASRVSLSVYDVLGRRVAVLVDGEVAPGAHRAVLDGAHLASGAYLVVMEAEGERRTRKLMLVR